jgi:hypothetical protein
MKVLLKIGRQEWLLPNDQGVSTLAKTLSKAKEADHGPRDYRNEDWTQVVSITGGAPAISVTYLDPKTEIVDKTLPLGLPEHGTRQD